MAKAASPIPNTIPHMPAIANPAPDAATLARTALVMKQMVEMLVGQRGDPMGRAVTFNDLLSLGVVSQVALTSPTGKATPVELSDIGYDQMPAEVRNSPPYVSVPGIVPAATRLWIVPILAPMLVPANLQGSQGYCYGPPTITQTLTISRLRASVTDLIGVATWAPSARTPTLSIQGATALDIGDVLTMLSGPTQDPTWADMGFGLMMKRNDV